MNPQPETTGYAQRYKNNILAHQTKIHQLKKIKFALSLGRLASFVLMVIIVWHFWAALVPAIITILLFLAIFILLIFRDSDQSEAIGHQERLIQINQHEIDALTQHLAMYDNGGVFAEPAHAYASDLDLFGEASLFQWLNRCHADQSKNLLAHYLKNPQSAPAIKSTQEAIRELAGKEAFCQHLQSASMASPLTLGAETKLKTWIQNPLSGYEKPFWKIFQYLYPIAPFCLVIAYGLDKISSNQLLAGILLLGIFQYFIVKKILPEYQLLSRIQLEMETIYTFLLLVEKEQFAARALCSLQERLKPATYDSAAAAIRAFNAILKKIEWRNNLVVYPFLALFLIWDLRQAIRLNQWKMKNQQQFGDWFGVIGEMEVFISLASVVRNQADWCFPEIADSYFVFEAREMGHPLIPSEKRIVNDFDLAGAGKVALITGSNMAGKSTFLRAVGVNTVLALMGSPVCARSLKLSRVHLVSSMRVADNLAENTSTFYAELKKLKYIIDMLEQDKEVFILLDEVLRGTNSDDRHKGTHALVKQLLNSSSVTIMATHDTELAHAGSGNASLHNFHFDGQVDGEELRFDYKIKSGICTSLNATQLMKKIGIHFQD